MHARSMSRIGVVPALALLLLGGVVSTQVPAPQGVPVANPVAPTPAALAAGRKAYDTNCASCHGNRAQGAEKAATPISIIQEQGGKQPPDLTDAATDHGSGDAAVFTV